MDFSLFAISVPRAFRGTLLIAFVPPVKVSQRSSPIFFSYLNLICLTVKIWKMSQFNVSVLICLAEAGERIRPCHCEQQFLGISFSVGPGPWAKNHFLSFTLGSFVLCAPSL